MIFYLINGLFNFFFEVESKSSFTCWPPQKAVLSSTACETDSGIRAGNSCLSRQGLEWSRWEKGFLDLGKGWNQTLFFWAKWDGEVTENVIYKNYQPRQNISLGLGGDRTSKNICHHLAMSLLQKIHNWGEAYGICLYCPMGNPCLGILRAFYSIHCAMQISEWRTMIYSGGGHIMFLH